MKKKIKLLLWIVFIGSMIFDTTIYAKGITNGNSPKLYLANQKEWRYAKINGKWYRRLYNHETQAYETDRIPV